MLAGADIVPPGFRPVGRSAARLGWLARRQAVSVTDTYEVEAIGYETMWLRCRQCGHTWRLLDGKTWRCPAEDRHDDRQPAGAEAQPAIS